jgi:hypothetical protein
MVKPREFSFPLPNAPQTKVFLSVTAYDHAVVVFLSAAADGATPPSNMGSFIYALPNASPPPISHLTNPLQQRDPAAMPLSAPLFEELETMDFATRLAKAVAKRAERPAYVTSAISLTNVGGKHDAADDVAAFRTVIDAIMAAVE